MKLLQIGLCMWYLLHVCMPDYDKITMGPFDAIIHRIEECTDVGEGKVRFDFKLRRLSRTIINLDMNVSSKVQLDDRFSALSRFSQFTNGGWKDNFFVKEFSHACSTALALIPQVLNKVVKAAGYPKAANCPLPAKNFTVKNLNLDFDFKSVTPVFAYNKYQGEVLLRKKGKVYGCVKMYIDIVPQRRYGTSKKRG